MTALPDRSFTLDRDAARSSRKGETDYALMLELWRTRRPECRDVALDMADRDREAARPNPQTVGLVAA